MSRTQVQALWRTASRPGVIAVQRNWPPFLAIQLAMVGMVCLYYFNPTVHAALRQLAQFKAESGLVFGFVAGFIAGGVTPEIAKLVTGRIGRLNGAWLKTVLFNGLVYGVVGVQVDLFYHFQTFLFGGGVDPLTLLVKTAFDMAVFTPFLCIPTAVAFFEWRARRWAGVARIFRLEGYGERVLPALIPCWAFWIPILLCVYSLPSDLQFCFANLAEAAWSILFIFIATDSHLAD